MDGSIKDSTGSSSLKDERGALAKWIQTYWLYIIILGSVLLLEVLVKVQNSSSGLFGTEDEWTVYQRSLYTLQNLRFPVFEPHQIPLSPFEATPGPILAFVGAILVLGEDPLALSYLGAMIGGAVFLALFYTSRIFFSGERDRNEMSLLAIGLAALSSPLVIRMQLFIGETIAFVLFLLAVGLYVKGKYIRVSLLAFAIGFTEEFTLVILLLTVLLSGLVCLFTMRDKKRFKWSVIIVAIGLVSEAILFITQGPSYRVGFISQGFFPFTDVVANAQTIIQFMGIMLPLVAVVGFLLLFRKFLARNFTLERNILLSWFSVCAIYSLFPPLLPGATIFRTLDYLALPASILGAYGLAVLISRRDQWTITKVVTLAILASGIYAWVFHRPTLISYVQSFGALLNDSGLVVLILVTTFASSASFFLIWRKAKTNRTGRISGFLAVLLIVSMFFVQSSFYAQYETKFYMSYLNSGETTFLTGAANSIPPNGIIATDFVLAANVAGLTGRTVKDLPANPTSAQMIFDDIQNASIYSEQFGSSGVVPAQLRVPVNSSQPIYLLVLDGYPGVLFTYPSVVNQLLHDSRFTLVSSSGNLYLFSVSL